MLLSFKAFTNVAPVSPSVQLDTTGTKTKQLLYPCTVVNFDGVVAAAGYLHVFDRITAPVSGTTIPLMIVRIEDDGSGAAQPLPSFLPSLGPIQLYNGLYFAMSSTEAVYTAVATNFDVWGAVEASSLMQLDALSYASVSASNSFQVWTNASGPKKLISLRVLAGSTWAALAYLQLFASDNPQPGDRPIEQWPLFDPTNGNATKSLPIVLEFGPNGLFVTQQSSPATTLKGCYFAVSTTAGTYTTDGTASVNLEAYYK